MLNEAAALNISWPPGNLLESWEDQGAVGHHHSQARDVVRDQLVLLQPLDCGRGVARGHALHLGPRGVGERQLVGRLDNPLWSAPPAALLLYLITMLSTNQVASVVIEVREVCEAARRS